MTANPVPDSDLTPAAPIDRRRVWRRCAPRTLLARVTLVLIGAIGCAEALAILTLRYQRHLALQDLAGPNWVVWAALAQLLVLGLLAFLGLRLVTRSLASLTFAIARLDTDLYFAALPERGPVEVANTARVLNAMQKRITECREERVEILAAISHDLQTPITRMRLRIDLMDQSAGLEKVRQDLEAMQALVREGLTYARAREGDAEPARRLDVSALLMSVVADYQDFGHAVWFEGDAGAPRVTRPQALRGILTSLVDNALEFGGSALVRAQPDDERLILAVLDDGPGVPGDQLEAVLEPFHRVESSRNRDTGGTGLGLAIAQRLATAIEAELSLHNRPEGGLEARLVMNPILN